MILFLADHKSHQTKKKKITELSQKNILISLIEFSKQSLHLENYSNSTFLYWKTKSIIFYSLKGKKRIFVQINRPVEFFLFACFFETKNIYSHTHSTNAGRLVIKSFHSADFRKQNYFFFWFYHSRDAVLEKNGRLLIKRGTRKNVLDFTNNSNALIGFIYILMNMRFECKAFIRMYP